MWHVTRQEWIDKLCLELNCVLLDFAERCGRVRDARLLGIGIEKARKSIREAALAWMNEVGVDKNGQVRTPG
jgi:hypothetical protein